MRLRVAGAVVALLALLAGFAVQALAKKDRTSLISRQSAGAGGLGGDDSSDDPMVSANGRFVVFESAADNLGGPAADTENIYVYDRERKRVELVSRQSKGAGGAGVDDFANDPSISDDGRYVAFQTSADNLGGGIDTGVTNVYVYDRKRDRVRLVSRQSRRAGGAAANDYSEDASISGNGRFVAFESEATNLGGPVQTAPGDDNVYVYDLERKRIELVSRRGSGPGGDDDSTTSSDGGGAISRTGRYVAFESAADNLGGPIDTSVDNIYLYDRKRNKTRLVSRRSKGAGGQGADGSSEGQVVAPGGRFVAFDTEATNLGGQLNTAPGDANVYLYDLERKRIRLVSRSSAGIGGNGFSENPSLSASGRFIAFETESDNLGGPIDPLASENVYVFDRERGRLQFVSRRSKPAGNQGGNDDSDTPSISGAGRFVVFESQATNLGGPIQTLANDDNIYLRDRG